MALSAPRPIFVGGIPQGISEDDQNEEFKYSNVRGNNEPKYISSPDFTKATTERIDFGNTGTINQDQFHQQNPDFLLQRVSDSRLSEPFSQERIERVNRLDIEIDRRRDLFEKKSDKYAKYNPKVPEG